MAIARVNQSAPQPRQLYSYVAQPQFYSDHHHPDRLNTPEGPISIAFTKSSRRSVHTNNDAVKGVVHVKARTQVKYVRIRFIGKTTCRVFNERNPTSQHIAEVELFRHERTLSKQEMPSSTCPPGRVEYPFEFRFPEAVESEPKNDAPFKSDECFENQNGHPLPPSFWWNESTIRNEYFLEAEFTTEQISFTLNPLVVHQLRFSPSVPELSLSGSITLLLPGPSLIRLERKSQPSTPEPFQERRGPLKRLKSGFRGVEKVEESSSTLLLLLSTPSHYRVGAPSTLEISLQTTPSDSTSQEAPVYLHGIRAQATAHIKFRIPTASSPGGEIRKDEVERFDLFNKRYSKPGLEVKQNITLEGFEIAKIVPPTFKTYGVAVTYDVRYDLLLECAAKESEHVVENRNVYIEPMTRPGGYLGPPENPPPPRSSSEYVLAADLMRDSRGRGPSLDGPPAYRR